MTETLLIEVEDARQTAEPQVEENVEPPLQADTPEVVRYGVRESVTRVAIRDPGLYERQYFAYSIPVRSGRRPRSLEMPLRFESVIQHSSVKRCTNHWLTYCPKTHCALCQQYAVADSSDPTIPKARKARYVTCLVGGWDGSEKVQETFKVYPTFLETTASLDWTEGDDGLQEPHGGPIGANPLWDELSTIKDIAPFDPDKPAYRNPNEVENLSYALSDYSNRVVRVENGILKI